VSYLGPMARRMEAVLSRLEEAAERLGPVPAAPKPVSLVDEAWEAAPLAARLAFVRSLLDRTHPYQTALQEASALEELRRKGPELESWLATYPSLFADSVARLEIDPNVAVAAADRLALRTLMEAHESIGSDLRALGVEWVEPKPGDAVGPDMEIVSSEHAPAPPGAVARTRRRGLRFRGRQVLPAQVVRSLGPEPSAVQAAPLPAPEAPRARDGEPEMNPVRPSAPGEPTPAGEPVWLVALRAAAPEAGTEGSRVITAIEEIAERSAAGADALALRGPLAAIAEWLGPRGPISSPSSDQAFADPREGMLAWLVGTLGVEPFSPVEGDPYDAGLMERVGSRRTAHPHEDGRVARVERAGLRRGSEAVVLAQVIVYEREDVP